MERLPRDLRVAGSYSHPVTLPNDNAPNRAKKMMTATDGLDRPFLASLRTDLGEAGFAELCQVACIELTALADQLRHAAAQLAGPATDGPCDETCACLTFSMSSKAAR